ncbi:MAG TPA: ADOP family duplicated permease [Acidobacteriaceae bacterium]|nr:ADOP family duplicated permease [Acidobacteriaceae bacterium]
MTNLIYDLRYALRQLRKSPGIAVIAILALALGIGANTAVFSLTYIILLRSLPVPHPDRLVEYEMRNGDQMIGLSGPEYAILRDRQRSCTGLLAWASDTALLTLNGHSEHTRIQLLTRNSFQILQMQPYLGNFFNEQDNMEDARGIPAVLSYDFWQRQFHGDENILGQPLTIAGHSVTVMGVMPRAFEGLTVNFHPEIYLPFSFADLIYGKEVRNGPGHFGHFVLGRLKPGISLTQAQAEIKALAPTIRREADPTGVYLNQFFKSFQLQVHSGRSGVSYVKMTYERTLLVLEMLAVFLLVLCCLNTALVMLARVSGRQQEYAMRSALGAGRMRLIRQVLVETTLLVIPGLIAGVLIGWLAAHALVTMLGERGGAASMDVRPNEVILGFNLAVSLLVALGAGLWPALRAARTTPALDLKQTDRSVAAKSLGGWVIVLQVAVSVCLLTTALLLGSTLTHLLTEKSGFRIQGAAFASIDLQDLKLKKIQIGEISGELIRQLERKPGIEAAANISGLPLPEVFGTSGEFSIDRKGNIHSNRHIFHLRVSPGYFHTLGTRLLEGHSTAPTDKGAMAQCIVSRAAAAYFFPGENAIGQLLHASTASQPDGTNFVSKHACRVTGMAEDARFISLRAPAPQMAYSVGNPETFTDPYLTLAVRGKSDTLALAALENTVKQVLPDGVATKYQTFRQLEDSDLRRERMLIDLSGVSAFLALMLTALGLYGLLMRSVALRAREISIRMALGASRRSVITAILKRTIFEVGIGIIVGTVAAIMLIRVIHQILTVSYGNGPWDYVAGIGMILVVGAASAWIPARRAASVDPMQALRAE